MYPLTKENERDDEYTQLHDLVDLGAELLRGEIAV